MGNIERGYSKTIEAILGYIQAITNLLTSMLMENLRGKSVLMETVHHENSCLIILYKKKCDDVCHQAVAYCIVNLY